MSAAKLLLFHEEAVQAQKLAENLSRRSMTVSIAATPDEALAQLDLAPFIDVALLALHGAGTQGMETLRRMKRDHPLVEVIVLTKEDGVHRAIDGMKQGAFDYATQPYDLDDLVRKIVLAKQKKRAHQEKILRAARKELLRRQRS